MVEHTGGGPAFPGGQQADMASLAGVVSISTPMGMSLRDYFAAKAMQGHIEVDGTRVWIWGAKDSNCEDTPYTELARMSYLMADAMLKAREAQ